MPAVGNGPTSSVKHAGVTLSHVPFTPTTQMSPVSAVDPQSTVIEVVP